MSWAQKDDYRHKPLDIHNRFFKWAGDVGKPFGREHWLVTFYAQLEFPKRIDAANELRRAWKAVRFRHPGIATVLHSDETKKVYYPVQDKETLEKWCKATFRVQEDAYSAKDVLNRHVKVPQVTCYWIPASSQVALISSHWRWDAHAAALVLNSLLSELETPSPAPSFDGSEAKYLAPSLDEVVGMPETWEPAGPSNLNSPPSDTNWSEVFFSQEETSALHPAARKQGLTIRTALHTSTIVKVSQSSPESHAPRYISFGCFDLRKHLPPAGNEWRDAAALRFTGRPLNPWKSEESDAIFVRVPFTEKCLAMMALVPPNAPKPADPMINSLGIIDNSIKNQYGPIAVKDVCFVNTNLTQSITIVVFTWKGQLHLSAEYNEVYYTAGFVDNFLLRVKDG
ncbi:hypothetical protein BDW59DRAFT_158316 [Aspergillus cavernicola]|uniref:Uncharacterized protein n=1 Tax=Aspergillus cavernicola TaxID=176166 RepID=A0ABR4ISY0_9EURO